MTEEKKNEGFFAKLAKTLSTTSKQLVWIYTINGIAWIWCSYALAFMQRDQIAEALSSNVCTVVIGQIGFYMISKTVENVFKFNNFSFTKKNNKDEADAFSESVLGASGPIEDPYVEEETELYENFDEGVIENGNEEYTVDPSCIQ